MNIPALIAPLLTEYGDEAISFILREGAGYVDALRNGREPSEEEKDKFYAALVKAEFMRGAE